MMNNKTHPHTLVLSIYGQYVMPRGGEIWIGILIRALASLGLNEGAVRALVSRLKRKGLLCNRHVGRYSFYRLTDRGLQVMRRGSERIKADPDDEWDGQWTVVTYSVPEKYRERRDTLRRSLNWLGFGALVPGTWISPRPLMAEVEEKWQSLGVLDYLEVFRAQHLGPSNPQSLVSQTWPQLPILRERYRAFIAKYEPHLQGFEAGTLDDQTCFAVHLCSLVDFAAISMDDPGLPSTLLPSDWPHASARTLLGRLAKDLGQPAEHYFEVLRQISPASSGPSQS